MGCRIAARRKGVMSRLGCKCQRTKAVAVTTAPVSDARWRPEAVSCSLSAIVSSATFSAAAGTSGAGSVRSLLEPRQDGVVAVAPGVEASESAARMAHPARLGLGDDLRAGSASARDDETVIATTTISI